MFGAGHNDVIAVVYNKQMLRQLDGILKGAAQVLDAAREKMAMAGDLPSNEVETLLAMRDEMAMRLARYDGDRQPGPSFGKGLYVPPEQLEVVADLEDDATDILDQLGVDRPDYECPEFRQCRQKAIESLVR